MVVRDLPGAILLTPHVGEASTNRGTLASVTELKDVHARVQVGFTVIINLHVIVGDGPEGVLLHEILEVVLGRVAALNVLGRDRRQEGEARGSVQVGNGLGVLGLQGIVPCLEVALRVRITERLSDDESDRKIERQCKG